MEKKAQVAESMLWLYRFLIIIIVVGGVILVVVRYYSTDYDIRSLETSMLTNKLLTCLKENSFAFDESTIKKCAIIDENIFINLTMTEYGKNDLERNASFGNKDLSILCQAQERKVTGKHLPYCFKDNYLVLENNKEKNLTVIIALQTVQNV
ncbi:MAG: hypothetical protein QXP53_01520 [Candidatus Pacearchaeota archaeon]